MGPRRQLQGGCSRLFANSGKQARGKLHIPRLVNVTLSEGYGIPCYPLKQKFCCKSSAASKPHAEYINHVMWIENEQKRQR
jgi:hypothetical protein